VRSRSKNRPALPPANSSTGISQRSRAPTFPLWFVGAEHYSQFIARVYRLVGSQWRMIPTAANGQPAVGAYARGSDGLFHAHTLQVFSVSNSQIQRNVVFWLPDLFQLFNLPLTL
jgi:RNA polymerase sigma-70 factor (ECF subfamily)